jgi:hypothetical protein
VLLTKVDEHLEFVIESNLIELCRRCFVSWGERRRTAGVLKGMI